MDRVLLSLAISIALIVYISIVYLLIKKSNQLKSAATRDQTQAVLRHIRYGGTVAALLWGALSIAASLEKTILPGYSLVFILPIAAVLVAITLVPWEKFLSITPLFIYVLISGFTFAYIHFLNLLKTLYNSLIGS